MAVSDLLAVCCLAEKGSTSTPRFNCLTAFELSHHCFQRWSSHYQQKVFWTRSLCAGALLECLCWLHAANLPVLQACFHCRSNADQTNCRSNPMTSCFIEYFQVLQKKHHQSSKGFKSPWIPTPFHLWRIPKTQKKNEAPEAPEAEPGVPRPSPRLARVPPAAPVAASRSPWAARPVAGPQRSSPFRPWVL